MPTVYNFVPARNRKYGWLPDRPDKRDKLYAAIQPAAISLPPEVDLRKLASPVEDQGKLSSCVGNACAGALEILENKNHPGGTLAPKLTFWQKVGCALKIKKTGCTGPNPNPTDFIFQDVSRLFIYYNARVKDGLEKRDGGAYIRSALKSLNAQGYCWEKDWDYNYSKVNARPSEFCYSDAIKRPITEYARLVTTNEMLTCLAEGYPFVLGITLFSSFMSDEAKSSGIINMPKTTESTMGGHAICCVGYNQNNERFLMRNSWGPWWGMNGYFTIPFDYVAGYGSDIWTIRR